MEHSPLKKVPAELRLEIFKLALRKEGPIHINLRHGTPRANPQNDRYRLALSVTCKAIRGESFPAYFEANAFSVKPWTPRAYRFGQPMYDEFEEAAWKKDLMRWLRYVPKVGKTGLREIEVDLGPWHSGSLVYRIGIYRSFEYLSPMRICETGLDQLTEYCTANDMTLHVNLRVDRDSHVRVDLRLPILDKERSLTIAHSEFQRAVEGTVPVGTRRRGYIDMPIVMRPELVATFDRGREDVCAMLKAVRMGGRDGRD